MNPLQTQNNEIKKQINNIHDNEIKGVPLDKYIFNRIMGRVDPIYYCENVLRAHLPEKRRHLHENQIELIRAVCNPQERKVAALMARQAGKCFAPDTLIMMYNGISKKVQDIQIGDFVMSPDNQPVEVIALGNGYEEMFEVQTEDNQNFTVNKSHILSLKKDNITVNITVNDYLKLSNKHKQELKGYRVDTKYKKPGKYLFDFKLNPKGIGQYYGFVINSDNHLFLLNDCTVVHNTESIASFSGYLLDNYPQMRIGVFTPRIQQAEVNLGRVSVFYQMNEDKLNNKIVKISKDKIELDNGSYVMAVSGSDQSNIEGLTFDIIVLDEAQKISDYTWSERIQPMGGATNAKMIKIGTPKTRNHFYKSFQIDPDNPKGNWKCVKRDWTQCPQLWALDKTMLPDPNTGILRPYSTYVLSLMPKSLKQEMFPNNPEVWFEGGMSVEDFKTQYMLEFIDGAGKFFGQDDIDKLRSGEFNWLEHGIQGERYFAGIDFAGSGAATADYTHISVIRVNPNGVKNKVYAYEMHGISYPEQMRVIDNMLNGYNARFKPERIFADYTGVGRPVIDSLIYDYGMTNLTGITFNGRDTFTNSGMNLKNVMFAQFRKDVENNNLHYPSKDWFIKSAGEDNIPFYHKMIGEWADLEQETRTTVNKIIQAPLGQHDDVCCADILANFATIVNTSRQMPKASTGHYRRIR